MQENSKQRKDGFATKFLSELEKLKNSKGKKMKIKFFFAFDTNWKRFLTFFKQEQNKRKRGQRNLGYAANLSITTKRRKRRRVIQQIHEVVTQETQNLEEQRSLLRDSLSETDLGVATFPEFQENNIQQEIIKNVSNVMNSEEMKKNRELRRILMNVLFQNVPHNHIVQLVPTCSLRTVQRNMAIQDQIQLLGKINLRIRKSQYSQE